MYKRPDPKKPLKEHPLQTEFGAYGFINTSNDPAWISPHLTELQDDGRFALHQFSSTIDQVKTLDMGDFRPEIAKAKREQLILQSKRAMLSFLKKHVQQYKEEITAVENAILRVTQPDKPSDSTKALLQELRNKEIRENIRQINPKNRRDAIAGSLERLQAVINNPDPSNIIIDQNALNELRREYAFKVDPSLIEQLNDQKQIYKMVRSRAADISATSAKMLIYSKLDDPLPPIEHYEVFTPQTDHEKVLADNRIQAWDKQQMKIVRDKELAEKNEGLNLEAGERAGRKLRQ